jgi:aspartokinase
MNQEGYIERIGDFFRKYHLSIDNIVSSETSITLTVNEKDVENTDMDIMILSLREYLENLEEN